MKYFFVIIFILMASSKLFSYEGSFEDVKKNYRPSDVYLLDRYGHVLETIRKNNEYRSLEWVTLPEVSKNFRELLLKSEDQNFYEHSGFDPKALVKAFIDRIKDKNSKRGASTITMQLINLLHPEMKGIKKDIWDKIDQIKLSIDLEKRWTKDQILEAYINLAPFRGELLGIKSTSFGLFNKAPSNLYDDEAAILVSMLRSPNADTNQVALRSCRLLEQKNCQSIYNKTIKLLSKNYSIKREYKTISILDKSFIKNNPLTQNIETTLSDKIQKTSLEALHEQIKKLRAQNLTDGAVIVIDNQTEEILAYVPNAGDGYSTSPRFDNLRAIRQAGSTLKPFIYSKAIDENLITKNTLIDDSELDVLVGKGSIYYPRNYDNEFHGKVEAQVALGSSLNVPAVKMLMLVGPEKIVEFLKKLKFQKLKSAGHYGPSLALGSVDVTLWDLAHGYMQLSKTKLLKEETKKTIFEMLSNAENRKLSFGTDSVLSMPFNIAVKTGTSKDMRDNWCVGFNQKYTVGVWVGNSNGKPMWNVSGVQGAAPILRTIFLELMKDGSSSTIIHFANQTKSEQIIKHELTKIKYPIDGEVIGYDPEIPPHLQQLIIDVIGMNDKLKLVLNNDEVLKRDGHYFWKIVKGKHHLKLIDNDGQNLSEIHFEVR